MGTLLVDELELGMRAALAIERESCARLAHALRMEVVRARAAAGAVRDAQFAMSMLPGRPARRGGYLINRHAGRGVGT